MMRKLTLIGATVLAGAGIALAAVAATQATQTPAAARTNPEETAIREAQDAFVKAYNSADVKALSDYFTDDAEVVDSSGEATRGQADIASMYTAAFKDAKGLKLEATADSIRFLTPDVARVQGHSLLSGGASEGSQESTFAALMVRRDGRWRLAELRDYTAPAEEASPSDHLQELEWMVGDWVDEGGNAKVRSSVRWAANESFLIRTYSVELNGEPSMDGTSFIGWDPQTAQIKSWVFDSEGGHGEGIWTRVADDRWVVKSQGVARDGRHHSATQTQTLVGKDTVKVTLTDRIVGGGIAPDILDVMMVRQAPLPDASSSKPLVNPGQAVPATGAPK